VNAVASANGFVLTSGVDSSPFSDQEGMGLVEGGEGSGGAAVLDPRFAFGGDFDAEAEETDLRIR
jgi:hypothetical protein